MEKYYRVSESELKELLTDSLRLSALDRDGVDNWEWYGEGFRNVIREYVTEYGLNAEDEDMDFRDIAQAMLTHDYVQVEEG